MNLIGNIIWIVFGGFIIFLEYLIAGILLCLTIIGIPFGLQAFKLSIVGLAPFGRRVSPESVDHGCLATFFNIVWIFIGGLWIAITHLILALLFAITIIGLPFAKQHVKLAGISLTPFGKKII
jgi:uncharacterized membrane protein YccF (DUF307 family)